MLHFLNEVEKIFQLPFKMLSILALNNKLILHWILETNLKVLWNLHCGWRSAVQMSIILNCFNIICLPFHNTSSFIPFSSIVCFLQDNAVDLFNTIYQTAKLFNTDSTPELMGYHYRSIVATSTFLLNNPVRRL